MSVVSDDDRLTLARLALVEAARQVVKNALGLLGIEAPERM
jgi:arginyl-tRNA synthetase